MSFFDDIGDVVSDVAEGVADVATSAVDAIGDAGDTIGAILKTIAPVVGMFPGIGTAFSVAIYAAGAASAGDNITDAVIGTASAAMPPGIPRIAFDGGTTLAKKVAAGENVWDSMFESMRAAAAKAGPAIQSAFETGVTIVRGGKFDAHTLDAARAQLLAGGGQMAATSFDAGVAIAQGKGADQVAIDIARGYIGDVGGPVARAAFDTGVALGYGKTLQSAGFIGLQSLVKGNTAAEKVLTFVDAVGRGEKVGLSVATVLTNDLTQAVMAAAGSYGVDYLKKSRGLIDPYIKMIGENSELLNRMPGELANELGINEAFVRAAQAVMASGSFNTELYNRITGGLIADASGVSVKSIGRNLPLDMEGFKEANDELQRIGLTLIAKDDRYIAQYKYGGIPGDAYAWKGKLTEMNFFLWQRGFAIGVGLALPGEYTDWGTGQETFAKRIPNVNEVLGYKAGIELAHKINRTKSAIKGTVKPMAKGIQAQTTSLFQSVVPLMNGYTTAQLQELEAYRVKGAAIAASNATIRAARDLNDDANYKKGFDVATACCQNRTVDSDAMQVIRRRLGPPPGSGSSAAGDMAMRGFDVGQSVQFGISKQIMNGQLDVSGNPVIAAGQMATNGLAGTRVTSATKENVLTTVTNNPATKAGAANAINANRSIWSKIAEFFGF